MRVLVPLATAALILAAAQFCAADPTSPPPPSAAPPGAALFDDRCGACHGLDPASGPLAPSLRGVVGRKIASLTDFDYSDALKAKRGGVWTEPLLATYLADPEAFAPGNQMTANEPDPAARKAIIDYLKTVQ